MMIVMGAMASRMTTAQRANPLPSLSVMHLARVEPTSLFVTSMEPLNGLNASQPVLPVLDLLQPTVNPVILDFIFILSQANVFHLLKDTLLILLITH